MNTNNEQTLALLERKNEIFIELETLSNAIPVQTPEEMLTGAKLRSELLKESAQIDEEISFHCQNNRALRDALNNACPRENLSPELTILFDKSLQIKSVANRLANNADMIKGHLEGEKEKLLSDIKKLNTGGSAAANRYYKTSQLNPSQNKRGSKLKEKYL